MANGDAWKIPDGRIGAEVSRQVTHAGLKIIRVAVQGGHAATCEVVAYPRDDLRPVEARYNGARGGRAA